MTRKDLIQSVTQSAHITTDQADAAITAIFQAISLAAVRGENTYLRRFGTFQVVIRRQKASNNLNGLHNALIPEHPTLKFRPGRILRARMQNPGNEHQ